ncbi:MAG: hypothetical protein ACTSRH_04625 [Promethearchaeota archaeon]
MSEENEFNENVRKISRLILTSPQKLIREEDLRNMIKDHDFNQIIGKVYHDLKQVGFELIKTKFQDETYYILTTEGKDDEITPTQYGILAILIALTNELGENLNLAYMKDLFVDLWEIDIKPLVKDNYLQIDENLGILRVSPLGKALLKEIAKNLTLKNLLSSFNLDDNSAQK